MVAFIAGGFREFFDSYFRRGNVGITEPQIDDVVSSSSTLNLERIDDRENVRGQVGNTAELHSGEGSELP